MDPKEIIGLIAGVFSSAALLPQLIKVIKEKDAKNLSLGMMLILITSNSLWIYYGFLIANLPIIATNIFSDTVNLLLLFFSIKYKKKEGQQ